MRPLLTNSREVQDNFYDSDTVPLQAWFDNGIIFNNSVTFFLAKENHSKGFICLFVESNPASQFYDQFSKLHCFVTARTSATDNWQFTCDGLKAVLKYVLGIIGARKHLCFIADGSTRQVLRIVCFLLLSIFFIYVLNLPKNWNPSVFYGVGQAIIELKQECENAREISSVSLNRSPPSHGKGFCRHLMKQPVTLVGTYRLKEVFG